MKSKLLSLTVVLAAWTLVLSGCCNNKNEDEALNEAIQLCLDNWWTHSLIHSQTAAYGECAFPSWVTCEDNLLRGGECDFEPHTENIDTEEKRLAGCEENAIGWIEDFEKWEDISINWEDESESGASFTRKWVVNYTKGWASWKIDVECVADFVDGSISASFGEAELDGETIDDVEVKVDWNGSSETYSDDELQAAVDTIMDTVNNKWDVKVEMRELAYQWDEESASQSSYCKELNSEVDECVVFKSRFYIPEQDAVMAWAFEPNTIIADYEWYLGRSNGGKWSVLTSGF